MLSSFGTFYFTFLSLLLHLTSANEYRQKQQQIRHNKNSLVQASQKEITSLLQKSKRESELEKQAFKISKLKQALITLNALTTKESYHIEVLRRRIQDEKLAVRSILVSFSTSQPMLDRMLHYEDRMKAKSPEWRLRMLKKQSQLINETLSLYDIRLESFERRTSSSSSSSSPSSLTSLSGVSPTAASHSPLSLAKRPLHMTDWPPFSSSSGPGSGLGPLDLRSFIQLANLCFPKNGDYYRLPVEHLNAGMYLLVRLVHVFSLVLDKHLPFLCDISHCKPRMGSHYRIELNNSLHSPSSASTFVSTSTSTSPPPLVSLASQASLASFRSLSKSDTLDSM